MSTHVKNSILYETFIYVTSCMQSQAKRVGRRWQRRKPRLLPGKIVSLVFVSVYALYLVYSMCIRRVRCVRCVLCVLVPCSMALIPGPLVRSVRGLRHHSRISCVF